MLRQDSSRPDVCIGNAEGFPLVLGYVILQQIKK